MSFYRALLLLYPASFRAQYGDELTKVFATRRRDASGFFGRMLLWIDAIFDAVLSAAQVHWDLFCQDLRYTLRGLARSPGFAMTAVLIAALGIGATTAAYTITDHVLIRPLPFPEQERLMMLWEDMSPGQYKQMEPSPANYRDWKRMSKSFSGMAASRGWSVAMTGTGEPQQMDGECVTADLFPMLGVQPILGRTFSADDDKPGAAGTVILSYGTWQSRFAADPTVAGKTVLLDGEPFTVIGVMPKRFNYRRHEVELWTPVRFKNSDFADRNDNYLNVLGKLKPNVTRAQAAAEMRLISENLRRLYPKDNEHVAVNIVPLSGQVSNRSRLMLLALLGAGICVLLIACTNLANLLLARALSRQKEIAIRNALGAGRERLVRQMLTESMLLSLCGGILGILLAYGSAPLLAKLVPSSLSVADVTTIDWRVVLFTLGITLLTGICFGLIPAAQTASNISASGLAEGSRAGSGNRKTRLRGALVVAEVAFSFALLIACGLLIRALWNLQQIDPGFRSENVLTMRTVLQMPRYDMTARRIAFYQRVLDQVHQLPGVSGAAYTSFLPIVVQGGIWPVTVAGQDQNLDRAFHQASLRFVTPGYLETMRIPLLRGRAVSESDTMQAASVAMVSRSFANQYWPKQDPIGRHFTFGLADRMVIGVVGDVKVRGLERDSEPQVYLSYKQVPDGDLTWYAPKDLVIRSSMQSDQLVSAVRRIVSGIDPQQPISDVQTLGKIVADDSAERSVQVQVLAGFAGLAIVLAGLGIHGLLSFAVGMRAREISVRMAVGAGLRHIIRLVLGESAILAAVGVSAGVLLAYAASQGIRALLVGVSPHDPITYAVATAIVLLVALFGSLLPLFRALRMDPVNALRSE
jgi:predicted permease